MAFPARMAPSDIGSEWNSAGSQVFKEKMNLRSKFHRGAAALLAIVALHVPARAQTPSPIQWRATPSSADLRRGESGGIAITANISPPWHIYAPTTPAGGPVATTIKLLATDALKANGKLSESKPERKKDEGFGIDVEYYEGSAKFFLPVQVDLKAPGKFTASVTVRFQACNDKLCLPPKTQTVSVNFVVESGPKRADHLKPAIMVGTATDISDAAGPSPAGAPLGPVTTGVIKRQGATGNGLLGFLALAFVSGLAALVTPCVFPMIPITVSLFAKQKERADGGWGLAGPLAYCGGIIGTFTLLGLVVSALFGASGITRFAAHPVLNLALAALFGVLALNLFGVFEIIVPSRILNRFQGKRDGGLMVPLLMGLVFTLTSFTCTVPFVGTALVSAAAGGPLRPALGMLVFSTAFALPFFVLALFPAMVSRLPRSGEWLVSAKAFMGFLELAAAVKFLQQADFTWQLGWITRPVFLAVWFALALMAAAYLFRWIRLPRETSDAKPGPGRLVLGSATLAAAALLLFANNGMNLRFLEGYVPPPDYGANAPAEASPWLKDNYRAALALAVSSHKPVLINFTGYACTNCRYMERNVLGTAPVTAELKNFVPVFLHTDGPDAVSLANSALQQAKIGTVAIPVYAVVTPQGQVKGTLEGLERDPEKFASFLRQSRAGIRLAGTLAG